MRATFFDTLLTEARRDERVELVVGDLGFGLVERFQAEFPTRYHNAGVAEQAMTGIATGLALCGSIVFTYSIANFPTLRCLEQVRNDVCYHQANVKVVAVGGGIGYGSLGFSHHGTEDVAIVRSLPGIVAACPGDAAETAAITKAITAYEGPAFLRIGRADDTPLHAQLPSLWPGRSITMIEGRDVTIIASGPVLGAAIEAVNRLSDQGLNPTLVSMPWVKPLDEITVQKAAESSALVVTVEEHSITGGLGGAVAEVMASSAGSARLLRLGFPDGFFKGVGSPDHLRTQLGLDGEGIARSVSTALRSLTGAIR